MYHLESDFLCHIHQMSGRLQNTKYTITVKKAYSESHSYVKLFWRTSNDKLYLKAFCLPYTILNHRWQSLLEAVITL